MERTKSTVSISTEEPDRSDETGGVRVLLLRDTDLPFKVGNLGVLAATWRSVESGPLFLLHREDLAGYRAICDSMERNNLNSGHTSLIFHLIYTLSSLSSSYFGPCSAWGGEFEVLAHAHRSQQNALRDESGA